MYQNWLADRFRKWSTAAKFHCCVQLYSLKQFLL
jgi:hypothetical protein